MYKIKKKYKLSIIFIILLIIIFISINQITSHKLNKTTISQDEIIKDILSYNINNNITEEFLNWIIQNYSDKTLIKLENNLKNNTYNDKIWHKLTGNSLIVLLDLYNNNYDNKTNISIKNTTKIITMNFIGDVSLAENWYITKAYDERNKQIKGIISENIINTLTKSDLTIVNNEFTISNRGTPTPGKLYHFKASPERLNIYKEMGVDLVTLANNHVYDYGEIAFNDMLEYLDKYKIPHIGAGKNIEQASQPYYFIINGYKIAFLNANRSEKNIKTPGATYTASGVLRCYDPTYFANLIKTTKQTSDYVIALIHWGKEDSHELENAQLETSKLYIDSGADIIIGTHAHVLQAVDFYKEKPIIYNLGDFIFNHETKDTMIFQTTIDQNGNLNYYILPAKQKKEYTYLLENEEKERVLNTISSWSPNVIIKSDGQILNK